MAHYHATPDRAFNDGRTNHLNLRPCILDDCPGVIFHLDDDALDLLFHAVRDYLTEHHRPGRPVDHDTVRRLVHEHTAARHRQ